MAVHPATGLATAPRPTRKLAVHPEGVGTLATCSRHLTVSAMAASTQKEPQPSVGERRRRSPLGTVHTDPALFEGVTVFLRDRHEAVLDSVENPELG